MNNEWLVSSLPRVVFAASAEFKAGSIVFPGLFWSFIKRKKKAVPVIGRQHEV